MAEGIEDTNLGVSVMTEDIEDPLVGGWVGGWVGRIVAAKV